MGIEMLRSDLNTLYNITMRIWKFPWPIKEKSKLFPVKKA
jgi:hypothetical protein